MDTWDLPQLPRLSDEFELLFASCVAACLLFAADIWVSNAAASASG